MFRKLTLIATLSLVLVGAIVAPAAAANATATAENGTVNASASSGTSGDLIRQGVGEDLGPVTLERWTFDPSTGALTLHLNAETATMITVSDAGKANEQQAQADGAGGQRIASTDHTLQSGENVLTLYPHTYDGGSRMAVSIGTTGDGYRLWTAGLAGGPNETYGSQTVQGLIAAAVIGTAWFTYRRVKASLAKDDLGARRVL